MQNHQSSPFDRPSQVFQGIRFVLLGFDPIHKAQVLRKLVNGGGVDAGQYGPNCTHIIVDKLSYDDPICVAARRDGKILVSALWADHSFDFGVPVDPTSVMYRPVRDLNGIPGAKSLVICLTGYQREDREDIMTMVSLMGAQFSKPLIANKITHLICYKFEGEKYLLAKKMKRIKLINHRWLEDCLKAWEIISEADYTKSGYELEMEAEAKDSEDEAGGAATILNEVKKESPHHSLMFKQDVSTSLPSASASKGFGKSPSFSDHRENVISLNCEPSNLFKGTASGSAAQNIAASPMVAKKSPPNEARKDISEIYSSKVSTPPTKRLDKINLSDAFNLSSSLLEKVNNGSEAGLRTPCNDPEEEQNGSPSGKRKMDFSYGSSKVQRMSLDEDKLSTESLHVESAFQELKKDPPADMSNHLSPQADISYLNDKAAVSPPQNLPSNSTRRVSLRSKGKGVACDPPAEMSNRLSPRAAVSPPQNAPSSATGRNSVSSKGKNVACDMPFSKVSTSETVEEEDLDAGRRPLEELKRTNSVTKFDSTDVGECVMPGKSSSSAVSCDLEKSAAPNMEINELSGGSSLKHVRRKSIAKKFSAPKQNLSKKKTENLKGSIYLKDSEPREDKDTTSTGDVQGLASDDKIEKEIQIENMSGNMDDETEPPEDKEKHEDGGEPEHTVDIVMEENADPDGVNENNDKDEDKSDDTEKLVSSKTCRGKKLPLSKKPKKKTALSVKDVTDKKAAKKKKLTSDDNNEKLEIKAALSVKEVTDKKAAKKKKLASDDNKEKLEIKAALSVKEVTDKKVTKKKELASDDNNENLEIKAALSVKEVTDKKVAKKKELASDDNNEKPEITEEATPLRASKRSKRNVNDLETAEGVCNDLDDDRTEHATSASDLNEENVMNKKATKRNKRPLSKTKKDVAAPVKELTDTKAVNKKGKPTSTGDMEAQKENIQVPVAGNKQSATEKITPKTKKVNVDPKTSAAAGKGEPMWFILSGHKLQRREFQQIIRRLKGKVCRVSHQWSYQATHFIVPDPIRRTEKFFAAAASGSWILKTDYLSASNEAGRFLPEEPYEWHKNGLSEDGQVNLEAPRKWRLLKEKTGHGAFYGMRILIYGECIAPPLDTLKRAVKAGDGSIVATAPPYTRFLNTGIDFAVVSPGMPHVDIWVQEFLKHEIPCVSADYLVEYVCKPGYPLERHVQYDTNVWAERSCNNLKNRVNQESSEPTTPDSNDVGCEVCGSHDRGNEMLICGNESGSVGCGVGMHIGCCDPPFEDVPEEDWFCPKCTTNKTTKRKGK